MDISYSSSNPDERILSNFAPTPFSITIGNETFQCLSVEGFWQGLKSQGEMRKHIFQLSGLAAKKAGAKKKADSFEIGGKEFRVASKEHEALIREAIRQKILQNPNAAHALQRSQGSLTHNVPGAAKAIFRMEKMLMSIRMELFGH